LNTKLTSKDQDSYEDDEVFVERVKESNQEVNDNEAIHEDSKGKEKSNKRINPKIKILNAALTLKLLSL
jgi:hypothetical protein